MQNEILKPVLETDETAIPRYDIVNPDGSVAQQNVELRLKNEVIQEGTPYDEDSVLPAELATQLGLPTTATPSQVLQLLATKSYDKDETLSNATKTLFGLDATAVPDDAFVALTDCFAQIFVTTLPNTEVTASLNGKTVSATSDSSGLAILKTPGLGTWTISASIYGVSVSKNYEIKAIAKYELVLLPDLNSTSWDAISSISESGNAASIWSVGDKKNISIGGTSYQVQIIGFNHDNKTAGGKAGITFQLTNCLYSTYKMNSSNTNVGGWTNCAMRTSTMTTILSQLPSDLQNVIKPVNKLTSAGNQSATINTTSDKLFLLSEVEIYGSTTYSKSGEGNQYAYYKAGNSKVKKVNGSAAYWWERSPDGSYSTPFCFVNTNGDAGRYDANDSRGVAFAFCV